MKLSIILSLFLTLSSPQVFAWTINADFENGAIGTTAQSSTDGFRTAAGRSKYADTPALSGSQSASVLATKGETGFGTWGGVFTFPAPLGEGDEVWYRVNVYYPTGWSFDCGNCNQGLKFMRISTTSATGKNEGYLSTLIGGGVGVGSVSAGTTGGLINVDSEVPNGFYGTGKSNSDIFGLGTPMQRNKWYTYEMYVKFSSVPGKAIYRIWQDGNLIFEDDVAGTLLTSTSMSSRALLYTYWNNGAPQTQTSYVDDIVITNEIPGRKDAQGNAYIGVGPSIYIAPPKPPPAVKQN